MRVSNIIDSDRSRNWDMDRYGNWHVWVVWYVEVRDGDEENNIVSEGLGGWILNPGFKYKIDNHTNKLGDEVTNEGIYIYNLK